MHEYTLYYGKKRRELFSNGLEYLKELLFFRFKARFYNITVINIYAPTNMKKKTFMSRYKTYMMISIRNIKQTLKLSRHINAKIGRKIGEKE